MSSTKSVLDGSCLFPSDLLPDTNATIDRIEMGRFEAVRPRSAGSNARLGVHGQHVRIPVVRITLSDGRQGFGLSFINQEKASDLIGVSLRQVFTGDDTGVQQAFRSIEFPLLDLLGQCTGLPVYALASGGVGEEPFRVRCYDTSLYFDDLDLTDDAEAAARLAGEAREGWDRGHRSFKIKVGRGGRHMPVEEGTRRDIAVIRAIREAVGPDAPLMMDANNGWNLNLTKRVLEETAECRLYWVEEAFHEDSVLYTDLKEWMQDRHIKTLIADGEGEASPSLIRWAREGIIDVLQYDIFGYGFSRWLELGQTIADRNVGSGPHHYGAFLGNYVTGHLARALPNFQYVEWDEAAAPGVDTSRYSIQEGMLVIPNAPGFGLTLDDAVYQKRVAAGGFTVGGK